MFPTHGPWCGSRTFPLKCRTCQADIFFFSCNHGSRVLFDQLGAPWPIHDCWTSWTRGLKRQKHPNGSISVPWRNGIVFIRPASDFSIGTLSIRRAQKKGATSYDIPIQAVEPSRDDDIELVGMLREITLTSDPFKALDLPNTAMTLAMLGPRWQQPVGKITVHVTSDDKDHFESYTAWIPSSRLKNEDIERGIPVEVVLKSITLPYEDYVWYCDDIFPLA